MLGRFQIDRIEDPVDHVATVAREQRRDVEVALLQGLFRIELIERSLKLTMGGFVARHLRAMKTRAQTFELMIDLAASRLERVSERGIDCAQMRFQIVKL